MGGPVSLTTVGGENSIGVSGCSGHRCGNWDFCISSESTN